MWCGCTATNLQSHKRTLAEEARPVRFRGLSGRASKTLRTSGISQKLPCYAINRDSCGRGIEAPEFFTVEPSKFAVGSEPALGMR